MSTPTHGEKLATSAAPTPVPAPQPLAELPQIPAQPANAPQEPHQVNNEDVLKLTREVEQLREQLAALQVTKLTRTPTAPLQETKLGNNYADAKRWALIQKGGLARFNALRLDERLLAQGQGPASQAEIDEAPKFFGKQSNAVEAQRLAKTNPAKYVRLRLISKETGTFGK